MSDLPFELEGRTLITGPSNVGKTRLTARAIERWVETRGSSGVVVLEFGPAYEYEGRVLGRHLEAFDAVPDDVWSGGIDAHAPRAQSSDEAGALELAAANADAARDLLETAPDSPDAVFVNDATIPFQHPTGDPAALFDYCEAAGCVVANALDRDRLVGDDPISQEERATLTTLHGWADRRIELTPD
jgi:hypothetical protein